MITKARVLSELNKFPDEFSIDELIEKLILIEKIEIGREQSRKGQVVSEEEFEYEVKKWFK